jgi:hypothetical protein
MKKILFCSSRALLLLTLFVPLSACITVDQYTPEYSFDRAYDYFAGRRYARALSEFDALISGKHGAASDSVLARAYQYRGECHIVLKRYVLARCDFADACRIAGRIGSSLPEGTLISLECSRSTGDSYLHEGACRVADGIFADLLAEKPSVRYSDSLLYRRYICAIKLGKPGPERFTNQIASLSNFDVDRLRREFLGHTMPAVSVALPLSEPETLPSSLAETDILPRSAWNAAPIRANIDPMTGITRITIHHTGEIWTSLDLEQTGKKIRDHQLFHQNGKGWADLGYHFLIDRCGRIWEGREIRFQGAHAGNSDLNRGNIGISLLGNYEEQQLNSLQEKSLNNLLTVLCYEYDLRLWHIVTHRELKNTACPGRYLQSFVEQIRSQTSP